VLLIYQFHPGANLDQFRTFGFRSFNDIEVKLVAAVAQPYEVAVASARTCYSGRGVIYPADVSKDERSVELRDRIAASTREAGHLTTRQHAHFVFALSGVSRQFIWSFLHSHPYYKSEQVSQRYVRVKRGSFLMPPLGEKAARLYGEAVDAQMSDYERLIEALKAPLADDFFDRFKARKKQPERWLSAIDKRAYEVARYALGLGTTAYLYHTVSALTLLRYAKLCEHFETPDEQREVVRRMVDCVRAADPLFEKELSDPVPLESTLEYRLHREFAESGRNSPERNAEFISQFDARLEGRVSKLVNYTQNAEGMLAEATRVALGRLESELSDEQALDLLLDPKNNPTLADTLNLASFDRLGQILHHAHFTFRKKISHAADSQDQRHRTVLSSRPILAYHLTGKPDYIVPFGVTQSAEAEDLYRRSMERSFTAVNRLLEEGVPAQHAYYLLPNALSIRMISSGDLQSYMHKWRLRACYNAQEEIFRATIDEVAQVKAVFPKLGEHLRAPCYYRLRAGVKPFCPEGDRFCGLPVWKYEISQYQRKSL
jgi:thymidylate synthase ThyX